MRRRKRQREEVGRGVGKIWGYGGRNGENTRANGGDEGKEKKKEEIKRCWAKQEKDDEVRGHGKDDEKEEEGENRWRRLRRRKPSTFFTPNYSCSSSSSSIEPFRLRSSWLNM